MKFKIIILEIILFQTVLLTAGVPQHRIPRGEVVDTIKCVGNRQQTYALYLPSYYTTDKKYPIIYVFEPAARGQLPVEKYKDLAEEYGYIMVCSNNSRNGPQEPIDRAAYAVFSDTKTRFTIDTNRVYTMGFSGGARVATRLAIQNNNIIGVIACGAGFPHGYQPTKWNKFTFVGLVGDLDMNYYELKNLENELDKVAIRHYMIYFNENHVWPAVSEMQKAFNYLNFDAGRRKLVKTDSAFIANYKKEKLDFLSNSNDVFKKYIGYQDLLMHLDGLSDNEVLQSKIHDLQNAPLVAQKLELQKHYCAVESKLAYTLNNAFYKPQEYTLQWWKNECKRINENAKDSSNIELQFLSKRMINKVYLMVFENFMLNREGMSFEESVRIFKIAALVKPASPYPEYYLAGIYAKNKKYSQALKMLENAISKGFSNLKYLKQDEAFEQIRDKKKYIELEKRIKQQ
jgi:dienelactone hydrolase